MRDNDFLKYQWLGDFDHDMVKLTKQSRMFTQRMGCLRMINEWDKVIAFERKGLLFAFNFHPDRSRTGVVVPVHEAAEYSLELSTDDVKYGGQGLVENMPYVTKEMDGGHALELYLPARTAIVLKAHPIRGGRKKNA